MPLTHISPTRIQKYIPDIDKAKAPSRSYSDSIYFGNKILKLGKILLVTIPVFFLSHDYMSIHTTLTQRPLKPSKLKGVWGFLPN